MRYRKKPVVIEAMEFNRKTYDELRSFTNRKANRLIIPRCMDGKATCCIETLEGDMLATEGDFIIKGIQGEFYPCKPDIFEASYVKDKSLELNVSVADTDTFKAVVEAFGLLVSKASKEDAELVTEIFGKYGLEEVSD